MGNRGRRWLTALAVAVTLTAACNGDDDTNGSPVITDPVESSSSTSSTSSTTTDPQAAVKAEVEAAYLAYWDAWLEIFAQPNPENPLIDQHTTAAVREVTIERLSDHVLNGRSVRPPADPADFNATVKSVTVEADSATVRACLVDGSVLVDNATGAVINDEVATLLLKAEVRREDNRWKVAGSTILEERDGRWTCDE